MQSERQAASRAASMGRGRRENGAGRTFSLIPARLAAGDGLCRTAAHTSTNTSPPSTLHG